MRAVPRPAGTGPRGEDLVRLDRHGRFGSARPGRLLPGTALPPPESQRQAGALPGGRPGPGLRPHSLQHTRLHRRDLEERTFAAADRISETIKRSARYSMLNNHRDEVYHIITTIGAQPGIGRIRIYNEQGRISFSTDEHEVGTFVDKRVEACVSCHAPGAAADAPEPARPPEDLPQREKGAAGRLDQPDRELTELLEGGVPRASRRPAGPRRPRRHGSPGQPRRDHRTRRTAHGGQHGHRHPRRLASGPASSHGSWCRSR